MKKSNNLFGRMAFLLFLMFSLAGYSQCNYTLEMNDSYGDGWNGNSVDVLVNGSVVLDDATFSGFNYSASLTFSVNTGDNISTIWNGGGSYGYETSYRILDSNNIEVGAGDESSIPSIAASCAAASGYCTPIPGSFQDTGGIASVNVGATVYPVSMPAFYQDLSGNTPDALQQGITADIGLVYGQTYTYDTWVWIDFGDDNVFDAGDLVAYVEGNGTLDLSFTMPANAPLGVHRMRIHGSDFNNEGGDPCYSGNYITVVDLDVEVIEPLCQQATIAGTDIVPDCDNAVPGYSVDVDIATGGDAQYITDGSSNWNIDNTGINTVGPFANGSTVNLTVVHADAACDINLGSFVYNCPPDNNDCGDAIAVGCGETYSGNTQYATISATPGSCGSTAINTAPGVWHTVVGTGGDIIIDTNDSGYDTKLGLFSGSCSGLICIDSDDDGGDGTRSQIQFSSNAGEIYYVYVTGYLTNTGAYNLTVDCVCDVEIVGGECQTVYDSSFGPLASTQLTANGLFGAGDFTYAWSDGQTGAQISVNPTEDTVYEVTATDAAGCTSTAMTTVLVVDVSCSNGNGDQDKVVVCHNGEEICISPNAVQAHLNHGDSIGSCDGPAVSCDTPPLCDSILKVPSPGAIDIPTTIEISWGQATGLVNGYVLSVGTTPGGTDVVDNLDVGLDLSYTLNGLDFNSMYYVTVVPYNSNGSAVGCDQSNSFTTVGSPWDAEATPINCGDVLAGNTNDGNVNDYLSFCGGTVNDAPGIWYTFVGDGYEMIVSTCGLAGFDTIISVYEGDSTAITCVGGSDDACGLQSEYSFVSTAGATYYMYVTPYSNFSSNPGPFSVSLTCPGPAPELPACTFAESISCGSSVTASTVGYDVNDLDTCTTSINTAPGRFYKVEGTGSSITVTTCNPGTQYDTKLAVFSGSCAGLVCIAGNDDFSNPDGSCVVSGVSTFNRASSVTFNSTSGDIYYIYVTGFGTGTFNQGQFELSVDCGGAPIVNNGNSTGLGAWTMYPNPASNGEVELDLTNYLNSDLEIQMMDFSGKLLINKAESNLQNPRYRMNTQNVSNGLYFVRVVTESGISIKKLIIAN